MERHLRMMFVASLAVLTTTAVEGVMSEELQGSWEDSVTLSSFYLETNSLVDDANDTGKARLSLCCRVGTFLTGNDCVQSANETEATLPLVYEVDLAPTNITASDEHFSFLVWNPCAGSNRYGLNPHLYEDEQWYLLSNGSVYRPEATDEDSLLNYDQYCLARVRNYDYAEYLAFFCEEAFPDDEDNEIVYSYGMIISVPFLVATFVVYWLLPEMRNIHGLTLRGYVGCLSVAYVMLTMVQLMPQDWLSYDGCIAIAFVIYFSFQASFFWLNVMCFDIWWTFGGFRSLQGSVKQREKKKFIMYSIYAWGCASILTILCLIMDFTPGIPETLIRPEFGYLRCWFTTDNAKGLYFYLPMSITVICNIFLFISTALKIIRHKKDTAHQLRSSESRRHDDNKQWFNLYLKLFIVMGINWSMEIISWAFKSAPAAVWYITDLTNALQGLIIFIIFVWKDKIRKLLLKRFGCREDIFSRNSTRSGCHSTSASRTITTGVSLQEKINPYVQNSNCRAKNSSDENSTDCPNV
ncbi:G-protein coupled receptor Mth2-like isoform X3 [Odontomachus brunneus]|uniref:G-protein coupled receptor Mth2-like isoform X3 n=1 Tax=Odontomachus brunneus TaxID=486640 RepID=UPI0013F23FFB|nr:G-protein coupled receptor Mth2-like isoform X3 [Odontomachus brunneus]XP_032664896.1 G-protein coupled receptor Mth2-like isoform X3 [Odontomachus brunneus]